MDNETLMLLLTGTLRHLHQPPVALWLCCDLTNLIIIKGPSSSCPLLQVDGELIYDSTVMVKIKCPPTHLNVCCFHVISEFLMYRLSVKANGHYLSLLPTRQDLAQGQWLVGQFTGGEGQAWAESRALLDFTDHRHP